MSSIVYRANRLSFHWVLANGTKLGLICLLANYYHSYVLFLFFFFLIAKNVQRDVSRRHGSFDYESYEMHEYGLTTIQPLKRT